MYEYITGTIDENRVLTFEDRVIYTGEQNRSALKIPTDMWAGKSPTYIIRFDTGSWRGRFASNLIEDENSSPAYIEEGFIICPLSFEMTRYGTAKIQLCVHMYDGDKEIIEKTSVAEVKARPSLGLSDLTLSQRLSIAGRFQKLESEIEEMKNELNFDYDYFCAAMAARLLYTGKEETPVYFPATLTEAESIASEILENYDSEANATHLIVTPAGSRSSAALMAVYTVDGVVTLGTFTGRALLNILRKGAVENE